MKKTLENESPMSGRKGFWGKAAQLANSKKISFLKYLDRKHIQFEKTNKKELQIIYLITKKQFILLLRNKIFIPTLFASSLFIIFSYLVSQWVITDFVAVSFEVSQTAFHFIGIFIAILWSWESSTILPIDLVSGISRSKILISHYLALVGVIFLYLILFVSLLQVSIFIFYKTALDIKMLSLFLQTSFELCVVGALGILFSILCSKNIAIFSTFSFWFIGWIVPGLAKSLPKDTDAVTAELVTFFAKIWNLNYFHIEVTVYNYKKIIGLTSIYGLSLVIIFLFLATFVLEKKDII